MPAPDRSSPKSDTLERVFKTIKGKKDLEQRVSPIPANEELNENIVLDEMEEPDEMDANKQMGLKDKKENNELDKKDKMENNKLDDKGIYWMKWKNWTRWMITNRWVKRTRRRTTSWTR